MFRRLRPSCARPRTTELGAEGTAEALAPPLLEGASRAAAAAAAASARRFSCCARSAFSSSS